MSDILTSMEDRVKQGFDRVRYDEGLLRILKVEIEDINVGRSGFSRSDTVQVSMVRYKRMAELAVNQLESEIL